MPTTNKNHRQINHYRDNHQKIDQARSTDHTTLKIIELCRDTELRDFSSHGVREHNVCPRCNYQRGTEHHAENKSDGKISGHEG